MVEQPLRSRGYRGLDDVQTEPADNLRAVVGLNLQRYRGKWVSVVDQQVVHVAERLEEVVLAAERRHPGKVPFVMRVPSEDLITV